MKSFPERLAALIAPLDPVAHAAEIERLRAARGLPDLDALARDGWLTPEGRRIRLKLVRHGSGTFLVVQYDQGWSKTLSQG
ncbi:MAG: hypothetical protein KC621_10640 [Myxococcales bacterium]|nr:hypothetical protein [Myxococcales bacterium]